MRVLVVLLHACFSVVGPIPFLLAAFFFLGHPYIGSTTVLPDKMVKCPTIAKSWGGQAHPPQSWGGGAMAPLIPTKNQSCVGLKKIFYFNCMLVSRVSKVCWETWINNVASSGTLKESFVVTEHLGQATCLQHTRYEEKQVLC